MVCIYEFLIFLATVINVKKVFFLFIPKKSATIPCKMLEEGVKLVGNGHKYEQKSQILLGKNSMYIMTFELYIQYALDVLWGQPIKLIQVVSTSEVHI